MREAWYNEDGLEACPKCHIRGKNLRCLSVDSAPPESNHRYRVLEKCKECHIEFEFYQDDIGISLHAKPKEKKVMEAYREAPPQLPETPKKRKRSKAEEVQELSEQVADELRRGLA